MSILFEKLLKRRGIDPNNLEAIETPSKNPLANIDELCARLKEIRDDDKKLVVLPDFDMDGIMSGTIGIAGLSQLGFNVELFVPDPKDGYGFREEQINRLIDQFPGTDAIITCDTGIGCREGVKHALSRGIDVLVTDHHTESQSATPRGLMDSKGREIVIVDPCAGEDEYEHPEICGAFVLWQCLDRYANLYGTKDDVDKISNLRAFAGVGTVSDLMPVMYENRQLIRDAIDDWKGFWTCESEKVSSLDGAPDAYKDAFRGMYLLCREFNKFGKVSSAEAIDEQFFGFYLAPTFNSIKRMDGDLRRAFDIFRGIDAKNNINYLLDLNEQRKHEVDEAVAAIEAQDNPYAPLIYVMPPDTKPGLMGLLATRMIDDGCCVVLAADPEHKGILKGSGRALEWYPFLSRAGESPIRAAGHQGAFGCSVEAKSIEKLYRFLREDVSKAYQEIVEELGEEAFAPEYDVSISEPGSSWQADSYADRDLLLEFHSEIETLRPFGRGFEQPTILLTLDGRNIQWSTMGAAGNHLKGRMGDVLEIISWNNAKYYDKVSGSSEVRIVGKLSINEFRGMCTPQITAEEILVY